jgi:hypothetical protein
MTTNGEIQSQARHINHLSSLRPNMENFSPKLDMSIVQVVTENLHFRSQLGLVHKLGYDRNLKILVAFQQVTPLSSLWPNMEKFGRKLDRSLASNLGPNLSTFDRMIHGGTL